MKKEIWKDITGYEGLYQVSSEGRVKSLKRKWRKKERILKPITIHNGFLGVVLSYDGKPRNFFIHRLVCQAFHENPDNKPQVNHINEDKTDNRACNLEWCNIRENFNHRERDERVSKALSKPIGQYTHDGKLVKIWQSAIEAERQEGFNHDNIGRAANGKYKQAYGFIWKYI